MHQRIHIPHAVNVLCPQNIIDANDILMAETQQDLDFSQRTLAVCLVLKWADFLDGYTLICHIIQSRAGQGGGGKKHRTDLTLHN